MKIEKLLKDKQALEKAYNRFIKKEANYKKAIRSVPGTYNKIR